MASNINVLDEIMSAISPKKAAKKQCKSRVKSLEKAIHKAVKKRLKSSVIEQLSVDEIDPLVIEEMAKNIAEQLLPVKTNIASNDTTTIEPISQLNAKPSSMSFALTPYKKPPCKACPAKSGGLCACAIKHGQQRQTG